MHVCMQVRIFEAKYLEKGEWYHNYRPTLTKQSQMGYRVMNDES